MVKAASCGSEVTYPSSSEILTPYTKVFIHKKKQLLSRVLINNTHGWLYIGEDLTAVMEGQLNQNDIEWITKDFVMKIHSAIQTQSVFHVSVKTYGNNNISQY